MKLEVWNRAGLPGTLPDPISIYQNRARMEMVSNDDVASVNARREYVGNVTVLVNQLVIVDTTAAPAVKSFCERIY